VAGKMDEVLGHFSVDLDARFSSIRTQETNIGNSSTSNFFFNFAFIIYTY